jgi:hypothetical protein
VINGLEGELQKDIPNPTNIPYERFNELATTFGCRTQTMHFTYETTEPKIEHFISNVKNYLIEGCVGLLLLLYLAMEEWLMLHH